MRYRRGGAFGNENRTATARAATALGGCFPLGSRGRAESKTAERTETGEAVSRDGQWDSDAEREAAQDGPGGTFGHHPGPIGRRRRRPGRASGDVPALAT